MRLILSLFFIIIVNACASTHGTDHAHIRKIKFAIESNNLADLKQYLSEKPDVFRCNNTGLKKVIQGRVSQNYCEADHEGHKLLKQTIESKPCNDDLVLALLEGGARYDFGSKYSTQKLLKETTENRCWKVTTHIINTYPPEQVSLAAVDFFMYSSHELNSYLNSLKEGLDADQTRVDEAAPILNTYKDFVMKNCPDIHQTTQACYAREMYEKKRRSDKAKLDEMEQYAKDLAAKEAYANTPKGMIEIACELQSKISQAQAVIDREKQVGKVSGTVNVYQLNKAGQDIVDFKAMKEDLQSKYQEMTGKVMDMKECAK